MICESLVCTRLQLFAMLEIYLLVYCAMVTKMQDQQMDEILDTILSICLIFLTLLIALGGFLMIFRNLRKMWFERKRKRMVEKGELVENDELAVADETEEERVKKNKKKTNDLFQFRDS